MNLNLDWLKSGVWYSDPYCTDLFADHFNPNPTTENLLIPQAMALMRPVLVFSTTFIRYSLNTRKVCYSDPFKLATPKYQIDFSNKFQPQNVAK